MGERKRRYQNWGARIIAYPCWIAATIIAAEIAAGRLKGREPYVAVVILLGISMPIGVKLSRLELTDAMVAVFRTGLEGAVADHEEREAIRREHERQSAT